VVTRYPNAHAKQAMQLYRRIQCKVFLFVFLNFSGLLRFSFFALQIYLIKFLEDFAEENTMQRSLGFESFSVSQLFLHHPPTIAFILRRFLFFCWGGGSLLRLSLSGHG
jgi:hypothetical protein